MTNRVLAPVLVLWCVLVVAPGLLAVLLFGIGYDGDLNGGVIWVWLGGYLVQFGVWWWIASKSGSSAILGWFVSSIMPWLACWSAPVSLWWLLVCLAVTAAYALWFYRGQERHDELQHNGIPAAGTVLQVIEPKMNVVINDVYIRRTLRLRVQRDDGAPAYEVKFKGTFMLGEIPSPGAVLRLRVDPADPQRVEADDRSDAAQQPTFSDWVPTGPGADDVADQLTRLADLHRRGDLDDAEYAAAKRRLLG